MDYELAIADRAYSSWSLRGWLLFDAFHIPVRTRVARLYSDGFGEMMARFAPARLVPAMRTPDGAVVGETIAIAEELASRHPGAGHWPQDPAMRGTARSLAAEMHAGFAALRRACPMNLRVAYQGVEVAPEVRTDLDRLEVIWAAARALARPDGPWLCGGYSAADAFFAPVAARIAGYGLEVGDAAQAYVAAHLAHGPFRRWRAMGLVDGPDQEIYARPYARADWPGPVPLVAAPVDSGPAENDACPYSGKPVTHFLRLEGRTFGFCNAFCRDKTVADPEAWPAFMAIYHA